MKVLDLMVDFIKMHVQSLVLKYGVLKSVVRLKMSILQIWVIWASKITFKNLQLCSVKIKGSHTPCEQPLYSGRLIIRTKWCGPD